MKTSKKARYPNAMNSTSDVIFIWIFPWHCQNKLDTQMSWTQHPMSFIYWFFHENFKKTRYPNVTNQACNVIFILVFPWKRQKRSIPKCHELNIRCHCYVYLPMKMSKQKRDTQMSQIKHAMSFLSGFSMKMSKETRYPNVMNSTSDVIFIRVFCMKNVQKKLDTQMSQIKHAMSFLSGFFHENVKKCAVPKCHELSIRCHVSIVCDEKI